MLDSTAAFPIHNLKYGDTSLISHCFTKKYGLRSFMLKGILNGKRKTVKKSLFQPLSHIEIVAQFKNTQNLSFVREAKLLTPYQSIPFDIRKNALLMFLSEILYQVLKEEAESNPQLFEFIRHSFIWLDQHENIGNFHLKFLLELSRHIGFFPNIENPDHAYFDLESGSTTPLLPHGLHLKTPLKSQWVSLLGTDFDSASTIRLSKLERAELLEQVITYFRLHLQHFSTPKSIAVLNDVFKHF